MHLVLTYFLIVINISERKTVNICFIHLSVAVETSAHERGFPTGNRKNCAARYFRSHGYEFLLLIFEGLLLF